MSSVQSSSKANTKGGNQKGGGSGTVIRTKTKPKVNPASGANFEFTNDPRVGDSFVIVIADPARNRQMTFHHPIGVTDVDEEDWVCTPTEDIPDLLNRRKDPDEEGIRSKRDNFRLRLAADAGLLGVDSQSEEVMYKGTNTSRQATVAAARQAAKEAVVGKGKPSADAYLAFIKDESLKKAESSIRLFLVEKETIRKAEKKFPSSGFRTKSGPLSDRVQSSVEYLEGLSRIEAIDAVTTRIYGLSQSA